MEPAGKQPFEREPPSLSYHGGSPGAPTSARPTAAQKAVRESGAGGRVLEGLTVGVLVTCLAVWALVGALFWIPLLVRTMILFSVALIEATLDGKAPTRTASMLRDAVTFYRRGFVMTHAAVMGRPTDAPASTAPTDLGRLGRELVWATLVWYVVLMTFGLAPTPGEIFVWLDEGPVGRGIARMADWVWGVIP